MRLPPGPVCLRCGMPWRPAQGCGRCARFGRPFAFARAAALWTYDGPVRDLVHAFKYGGRRDVLVPLGRRMAHSARLGSLARDAPDALVVHVPARAAARRERGYDQAEGLAQGLARALGRPHEAAALRRRRQPSLAQAGRSVAARRRLVRATFAARRSLVDGRAVLLVDDVLSTGATADAAARALRLAGARDVTVLALAT